MPPHTKNKTPVVVYLEDEDHAKLRARAGGESLSSEARRILHAALAADRGAGERQGRSPIAPSI